MLFSIIGSIPYRAIRKLLFWIRRRFFSIEPPHGVKGFSTNLTVDELTKYFGERNFIPGYFASYHYYGEDENIIRVRYDENFEYPWRQLHIRLFDRGDTTFMYVHEEPYALVKGQAKAHLKEKEFSESRGRKMLKDILEEDHNYVNHKVESF